MKEKRIIEVIHSLLSFHNHSEYLQPKIHIKKEDLEKVFQSHL